MEKDSKKIYARINEIAAETDPGRYDMHACEMKALYEQAPGKMDAIGLAFMFGFVKGQRSVQKK